MRILRVLTFAVLGTTIGLIYAGRPGTREQAPAHAMPTGAGHWGRNRTHTESRKATWPQAPNTVAEKNTAFEPDSLEIELGETVTFLNRDAVPHAVRINDEDLTWQAPGESVEWKAETAGVYRYLCNIHPEMTGEIVVK